MLPIAAALVLSLLAVGIHYEALGLTSRWVASKPRLRRPRVALAIVFALFAHLLEVILFAAGWGLLVLAGEVAISEPDPGIRDLVYFSMITYTSVGYGDIVPLGGARILAGVEGLVGLVLIAWTASFSYYEMMRYWGDEPQGPPP